MVDFSSSLQCMLLLMFGDVKKTLLLRPTSRSIIKIILCGNKIIQLHIESLFRRFETGSLNNCLNYKFSNHTIPIVLV